MIVNPAPGALVRDPATGNAIGDGAKVDENDPYIARALTDGDLVAAPAPKAAKSSSGSTDTQEEGSK